MGDNSIRKYMAIEEARQTTTKTIGGLEASVEQLTKELAVAQDRLATVQTIDEETQKEENTRREQLQVE